jgi:predicted nucleic acid-binding Zn ribbon protein
VSEHQQASQIASLREHRRCAICDTPIGDRRPTAVTCSDRCRKAMSVQRRVRGNALSAEQLRITTEEQRERLHAARRQGGLCSACGREFDAAEPVYWERFVVDVDRFAEAAAGRYRSTPEAPVGAECASSDFVGELAGREPELCAGCGRPVYYRATHRAHRRALCSRRCANIAKRRKAAG